MAIRHISNETGMSLVGVLVGAAAALAIGLAMSQMITTQADLVSYMEDRLSAVSLRSELNLTLSNSNACIVSLNKGQFRSIAGSGRERNIGIIYDGEGSRQIFSTAKDYEKIKIAAINAQATSAILPNRSGEVEFTINLERTRGKVAKNLAPIVIRKAVTLGPASNVIECTEVNPAGDEGVGNGLVPGRIANISNGCGMPPDSAFNSRSGRVSNPYKALEPAVQKWKSYCSTLSYPQAKAAYNFYFDTGSEKIPVSQSINTSSGTRGSAARMPSTSRDYLLVNGKWQQSSPELFKIEKLTGAAGEEQVRPQVRGPYANLYQCENDGIFELGTEFSISQTSGGGSGQDGSGSGSDTVSVSGKCAKGTW